MADRRLLNLLVMFYEVCKNVLEEFLETTYCSGKETTNLSGDLTDSALLNYIKKHSLNLYDHIKNSKCHLCSNSDNPCIQFSTQQFMPFFIQGRIHDDVTVNDIQTLPVSSFSVKSVRVEDLNIIKLQYLLLAANLETEKHDWLVVLHQQRKNISKLSWDNLVDDATFNSIWDDGHKMILNFAKSFKNRKDIRTIENSLEFLKMTQLTNEKVMPYCHLMETEFNVQRKEPMGQIINLQTDSIIVGNNNVQQIIYDFPEELQTQLQESLQDRRETVQEQKKVMLEQREVIQEQNKVMHQQNEVIQEQREFFKEQKHVLHRIENMIIVGKVNSEQQEDNEVEGATGGLTNQEHFEDLSSGRRKVDCTLQIPNDINTQENRDKISTIGSIEIEGHGSIVITFVKKGSLIIGTTMPERVLNNENSFLQAIHVFLQKIIDVCRINTSTYSVLKLEIHIRQPVKDKEIVSGCKECGEKTKLIQNLENNLQQAFKEFSESKYGKISPTRDKKDQVGDFYKGLDTSLGEVNPYESSRKDIYFAEFPHVRVKARTAYLHIAEDKIVVTMKRGVVYYLVAEMGDWWEISDGSGKSFFVLSEYAEYEDPLKSPKWKSIQNLESYGDNPEAIDIQQTKKRNDIPSDIEDIPDTTEVYAEIADVSKTKEKLAEILTFDIPKSPEIPKSRTLPTPGRHKRNMIRSVSESHILSDVTADSSKRGQSKKTRPQTVPAEDLLRKNIQSDDQDSPTTGVKSKLKKFGMSVLGLSSAKFVVETASLNDDPMSKVEFQKLRTFIDRFLRRRPDRDRLIQKGIIHATIFGSSLQNLCIEGGTSQTMVPPFIRMCVTAIERGIKKPGIYRYHSSPADVQTLRYHIEQAQYDLYSEKWTVYTIADILLLFLKELKEPLLPTSIIKIWPLRKVDWNTQMKKAIQKLPRWNHDTFQFLCKHFRRVISYSGENQMDVQSLAEAVGASLMDIQDCAKATSLNVQRAAERADQILSFCLVEYNFIFDE